LRWALYEAAKNASHQRSPDHDYYADVKDHLNGKLATISMARKLARRCYHVLRAIDSDVVYATPGTLPSRFVAGTAHPHITGRLAVSSRNRRARQHPCWTASKH